MPCLEVGGAERTTVEIASAVVAAGGRALVVSQGGRLADEITAAGGEVILLPVHRKDPFSIRSNASRIAALAGEHGVHIIHARSRAPAWSGLLAARRIGVPFVTTFHGAHSAGSPLKRWYNSALVKGDAVIANSRYTAEKILGEYGFDEGRLTIIHRGADLKRFARSQVSDARLRAAFEAFGGGGPEKPVRFLLPARLTPWKGQRLAIEAAALLKEKVNAGKAPDFRLVFCGGAQDDSQFQAVLRADMEKRGVRDMVQLVGECADMPAAYAWADAVIGAFALRPEPFGRVVLWKRGLWASRSSPQRTMAALPRPLWMKRLAFCSNRKTPDALSVGMARLADDPALRARLGDAAASRVRALYSSEAMCAATLDVYRQLLGRGV